MRSRTRVFRHIPVWWAWAVEPETRRLIVIGWETTEMDAQQLGFRKFGGLPFQTVELKTTDRTHARDMINAQRLGDDTTVLEVLTKRAKYKV